MLGVAAKVSARAAVPTIISEGLEASHITAEGRDAGTGPGADAMDVEDTEQV